MSPRPAWTSCASRAYYAMFQAAQVALRMVQVGRAEWTHGALQAALVTELIRRRKHECGSSWWRNRMKRYYMDGGIPTLAVALSEYMNVDEIKKLATLTGSPAAERPQRASASAGVAVGARPGP